jgi:sirohydrochlorin ferrochelatase
MKSLLLIAHGSRREASNSEIRALTNQLRSRVKDRFQYVACAFLEFEEPSIDTAIDAAVQAGGSEITILPYFLACGTHVTKDLPALVTAKGAQHSAATIDLKPYVGASPAMLELLASCI